MTINIATYPQVWTTPFKVPVKYKTLFNIVKLICIITGDVSEKLFKTLKYHNYALYVLSYTIIPLSYTIVFKNILFVSIQLYMCIRVLNYSFMIYRRWPLSFWLWYDLVWWCRWQPDLHDRVILIDLLIYVWIAYEMIGYQTIRKKEETNAFYQAPYFKFFRNSFILMF